MIRGPNRPEMNRGWREEQERDLLEQARREHLAEEARPTWWSRLKRRFRPPAA
jgi:hypothetical protein